MSWVALVSWPTFVFRLLQLLGGTFLFVCFLFLVYFIIIIFFQMRGPGREWGWRIGGLDFRFGLHPKCI